MARLMMILFGMIATVLMGIGVIIVLTIEKDTWQMIALAAAVGFVLAIPVSWFTARLMIGKLA